MAKLNCWNCGSSLDDVPRPISRHANCQQCFEVLHCCRMCRWYAPGRPGDCDHDRADPPVEKEIANFCEYYSPVSAFAKDDGDRKDAAKSKFSSLFDEDGGRDSADDDTDVMNDDPDEAVKSKFDDLFKD